MLINQVLSAQEPFAFPCFALVALLGPRNGERDGDAIIGGASGAREGREIAAEAEAGGEIRREALA